DFATRDRYRHVIEKIARRTKSSELEIARLAQTLALNSHRSVPDEQRKAHVGYYLLDWGRAELEKAAGFRARLHERFFRSVLKHPTAAYLGSFSFLTALALAL